MTNSDKNFITCSELMKIAIQIEVDSVNLYHRMQGMTENNEVIGLLQLLEKEEQEHERKLREFDLSEYENDIIQFPPDFSNVLPTEIAEDLSFENLVELAIEREQIAVRVYENCAEMLSDKLKELLSGLARFEKRHEEKLKSLLLY